MNLVPKSILLTIGYFVLCTGLVAQQPTKYSKAKIDLTEKNMIALAQNGIEIDHGIHVPGRYLINDYSLEELQTIKSLGYDIQILIEDVQSFYSNQNNSKLTQETNLSKDNCVKDFSPHHNIITPVNYREGSMGGFHTYKEMLEQIDSMKLLFPSLISNKSYVSNTKTHQGNHVFYLRISNEPDTHNEDKSQILYTALHHAREPASLSQMLFFMWYLLENYENDALVKAVVDNIQLTFVTCLNPDGYMINETNNPSGGGMWRKNGMKIGNQLQGVDLNRNYGYFWGLNESGSSSNPSSQVYRGNAPFSEPETQFMRDLCLKYNFKIALNYHSFGQLLIHPWGYNSTPTEDDRLFKKLAQILTIENSYKYGTVLETVGYLANGGSDDWLYGETGEKQPILAYTPEVGTSFWPHKDEILPINKACIWTNLAAALFELPYYKVTPHETISYVTKNHQKVDVNISKIGIQNGDVRVKLVPLTEGIFIENDTHELSLPFGVDTIVSFYFERNELLALGVTGFDFELIVEQLGFISSEFIHRTWFDAELITIYDNRVENMDNMLTSGFVLNKNQSYSGDFSFKESKYEQTPTDYRAWLLINQPINLATAKRALLEFYLKWDVEQGFDYFLVEASTNKQTFIPLCGIYTKMGSRNQLFNEPIYDGHNWIWTKEHINLDNFCGNQNVWLRFRIVTDGAQSGKGVHLDDISVKIIEQESVSTTEYFKKHLQNLDILLKEINNLHFPQLEINQCYKFYLTDLQGNRLFNVPFCGNDLELNTKNLPKGMYFYSILGDENRPIQKGKMVQAF